MVNHPLSIFRVGSFRNSPAATEGVVVADDFLHAQPVYILHVLWGFGPKFRRPADFSAAGVDMPVMSPSLPPQVGENLPAADSSGVPEDKPKVLWISGADFYGECRSWAGHRSFPGVDVYPLGRVASGKHFVQIRGNSAQGNKALPQNILLPEAAAMAVLL